MAEPYGSWVKYDAETMTINKYDKWLCFDGKDYIVIPGSAVPDGCALYMEDGCSFGPHSCCTPTTTNKSGWYVTLDFYTPIYRTEAGEWRDTLNRIVAPQDHTSIWYFAPTLCESLAASGVTVEGIALPTGAVPAVTTELPAILGTAIKADSGKPRFDLIPASAELEVAKVFTYGAMKYEDHNWAKGLAHSRMFAAARRHLNSYSLGEDLDPETSIEHLAHAICSLQMLLASRLEGLGKDDRRIAHLVSLPVEDMLWPNRT